MMDLIIRFCFCASLPDTVLTVLSSLDIVVTYVMAAARSLKRVGNRWTVAHRGPHSWKFCPLRGGIIVRHQFCGTQAATE
jgi:hypothetical protein